MVEMAKFRKDEYGRPVQAPASAVGPARVPAVAQPATTPSILGAIDSGMASLATRAWGALRPRSAEAAPAPDLAAAPAATPSAASAPPSASSDYAGFNYQGGFQGGGLMINPTPERIAAATATFNKSPQAVRNVDVMRGGNVQTTSFAPEPAAADLSQGPRLNADGTYTHKVGQAYDGFQRVATGTDKAYYDSQIETAPGQYGAFRNAATGAVFGSMAEAERASSADVVQALSKAGESDAEARLKNVTADLAPELARSEVGLRGAQSGYYGQLGQQAGAQAEATRSGVKSAAIRQTKFTTGYDKFGNPTGEDVAITVPDGRGGFRSTTLSREMGGASPQGALAARVSKLTPEQKSLVTKYFGDADVTPEDVLAYIQQQFGD